MDTLGFATASSEVTLSVLPFSDAYTWGSFAATLDTLQRHMSENNEWVTNVWEVEHRGPHRLFASGGIYRRSGMTPDLQMPNDVESN